MSGECFAEWMYALNLTTRDAKRACTLLGKRYVDLSGEPHFLRKMVGL